MNKYQYPIAALLAIGLTIGSGAVIGKMSNRWGPSPDSLAAARKLESFPEEFDEGEFRNWKLQSSDKMGKDAINMLECIGYISRVYVNQESGEKVSVSVILGPSGPISRHVPEPKPGGCLDPEKWKEIEPRKATAVGNSGDQFWALTCEKKDLKANLMRVYYGWTPGNHWAATEKPRWSLASSPYLYKIQLTSHHPAGTDLKSLKKNEPCKNFLKDFIPVMKEYLIDCSDGR